MRFVERLEIEQRSIVGNCCAFLHSPGGEPFQSFLPYLALEGRTAFDRYQSSHNDDVHTSVSKFEYIASFVRLPNEWAERAALEGVKFKATRREKPFLFAGIFRRLGSTYKDAAEVFSDPYRVGMQRLLGSKGLSEEAERAKNRGGCWLYRVERTGMMRQHIGKLVGFGTPTARYFRLVESWTGDTIFVDRAYNIYSDWLGMPGRVKNELRRAIERKKP